MPIYTIDKNKAKQLPLKREGFNNEFGLRDFFADNLEEILGVRFLEKEYTTTDGRIDTLGIDENNSPVIIEYKWKENEEVLAQGLFYLNWLLKNKPHFNLLVKNKLGNEAEVSWDKPRVILIAQGFSRYIKSAVQQVDNVELKTYTLYEGNILQIDNEYSPFGEKERMKKVEKVESEKSKDKYDLQYHLNITSSEMRDTFLRLRDKILELPSIEERGEQASGVTYATTKSFVRFQFKGTWIELLIRATTYPEDTQGRIEDITRYGYGYHGKIKFMPKDDIDYIFSLITASYNSTL